MTRDEIDDNSVIRHEEELRVGTTEVDAGSVMARKFVEHHPFEQVVPRSVEQYGDTERVEVAEGDSGEVETLPDGSVSIPLFEERIVVTKELVVRERIIIRKRTLTEEMRVEADLKVERINFEVDEAPR